MKPKSLAQFGPKYPPDLSNHIRSLASNRALGNFDKIIDKSGMAKEHSTTYHIFNHNLYKNIFKLIGNNETATDKLLKYLKMNDVLLQLVKPDLTFPLWGDSQIEILNPKIIADFGDDARLSATYENYDLKSNVNFENNIATLRTNTKDKSYLALFANYNSVVHKHHDDLSIVFQTFGTDIFTDQGYYGYDKKYRPQLTSVFAHNTVAINNEDYTIGKKNQYSKINSYTRNNDFETVEASHNMYDSLTVSRKVYFVKPNLVIMKDSANGLKKVNSLHQIFNLAKGASKIEIMENKINFSMPKNLNISMFTTNKDNKFIKREFYRSVKPFNIEDSYQIILESNKQNVTTFILIDSDAYELKITNPKLKDDILYYYKGNEKHQIDLH
tara:strand:- start:1625 stop:2779 length:1155 start_codon:yes stop_codon:yes gene_type:complete